MLDFMFRLPDDVVIYPPMDGHYLAPVVAGEATIMYVDLRYVRITAVEPPPPPPPPPDPTPPVIETYVVIVDSLNVRIDHTTTAAIVRRVTLNKDLVLIVGEQFEDAPNKILWRKTSDNNWAAISRDGVIYAKPSTTGG